LSSAEICATHRSQLTGREGMLVVLMPLVLAGALASGSQAHGSTGADSEGADWLSSVLARLGHNFSLSVEDTLLLCKNLSYAEARARVELKSFEPPSEAAFDAFFSSLCNGVCPSPRAPDFRVKCEEGAHAFRATFRELAGHRASYQWELLFIVFWLLLGVGFRHFNPSWLPYTVSLLLLGLLLGAVAELVEQSPSCPHNLLLHDYDLDNKVSVVEYESALCVSCHPKSFCMDSQNTATKWGFGKRTCGDGTAAPASCPFDFDSLDSPWKKSSMHPESVTSTAGSGYLEADELWTSRCNGLRDLLVLSDIDPHVLLVLFLPPLLFESAAFGLDFGIFRKQIWQSVLMAFPAMIVASAVTGGLLFAQTTNQAMGWTFWQCWLVGIINSATDPVAVVALLKDLGTDKNLGSLIEGESLLNDGSAVVLFTWVKNVIGYDHSTVGPSWMFSAQGDETYARYGGLVGVELLRVVAQMLLFGVLFGAAAGKICCFLLRRVYEDAIAEVSLMVGISYLLFWLSELLMGTSAVIAVVVMGLVVNEGKGAISPGSLHPIHTLFGVVAHVLNTLIFAICGSKLGIIVASGTFFEQSEFYLWATIYPIVLFARGVAVLAFFPLLRRLGTGCTWKEAVVVWWGGLRGSVGLALALVLFHTNWSNDMWGGKPFYDEQSSVQEGLAPLLCTDVPSSALLMTCMVVLLTVSVNGILMAPLLSALGLTKTPEVRRFAVRKALAMLSKRMVDFIAALQADKDLAHADWDEVSSILPLDKWRVSHQTTATTEEEAVKVANGCGGCRCKKTGPAVAGKEHDMERNAWLHTIQMERSSYLAQYEKGTLASEAFGALEASIAPLAAAANDAHKSSAEIHTMYDAAHEALVQKVVQRVECASMSVSVAWNVAIGFKHAMRDVAHLTHDDEAYAGVTTAHKASLARTGALVATLVGNHADLVKALETRYAKKLVLHQQVELLNHLLHEGVVSDLDAASLVKAPQRELHRLDAASMAHPEVRFDAASMALQAALVSTKNWVAAKFQRK